MTDRNARRRPLSAGYHVARRVSRPARSHRGVQHRHGYVFGFPACSASQLDEYLDDSGSLND